MVDDFGNRVRLARAQRRLTQRQLAEMTGVNRPTIAAIENGKRHPSAAVRTTLQRPLRRRPSEALRAHRDEVRDAIARAHGAASMVVGSVARGTDTVDSDLDLMVVGSVARGTDTVDSDLDLMVTFEPHMTDLADGYGSCRRACSGRSRATVTQDRVARRLAELASMAKVASGIVAKGEDAYLADDVDRHTLRLAGRQLVVQVATVVEKLPEDFNAQYPAVEWVKIQRMRNLVAHRYDQALDEFIRETLGTRLPQLVTTLQLER